jgi:putative aldouronate transport system permease protein
MIPLGYKCAVRRDIMSEKENELYGGGRTAVEDKMAAEQAGKKASESYSVDMSREKELERQVLKIDTKKKKVREPAWMVFGAQRIVAFLMFFMVFLPSMNPAKLTALISNNLSLFTSAISYGSLTENVGRGFRMGWVEEGTFNILFIGSILTLVGVLVIAAGACLSLGNTKCKRLSFIVSIAGVVLLTVGLVVIYMAYQQFKDAKKQDKVQASFASGIIIYGILGAIILILTIVEFFLVPRAEKGSKFAMETKFKLFLMFIPFAMLAFVFCYLPLWGWRYAFFDYKAGGELSSKTFVGFKWFKYLFENEATKRDIVRVLKNTLAMSGLGILTSWIPLAFAVFLTEIKSRPFKRIVQTFTTIPNFISWILVYTVALAIFSTDGFFNMIFGTSGNHLMGDSNTWLKMLIWGIWKGVGWSAIIYIAGIAGIDKQLYEAARVDGAGRWHRIWHVTLPGLMPTYMVMLLLSVAGMLSNGLDQYLVFSNASNMEHMEVLDLYVYHLGFGGGSIPLSTVIGMAKSLVSVFLLFLANGVSKVVRHESIV